MLEILGMRSDDYHPVRDVTPTVPAVRAKLCAASPTRICVSIR